MQRKGLSEAEPTEPFFFSPHAEERSRSARGAGAACGEKLVKGARATEFLRALERSLGHPDILVAVSPEELTRLAPVGGLITADERTEGSILAKLLVRVGGSVLLAAELESAAEATPLLLSRWLSGTLRRTQGELGGFLSRLSCG